MVERHRALLLASDGWPFLLVALAALVAAVTAGLWWLALPLGVLLCLLVLLFRDPPRRAPAHPRAVLSPVDGRVIAVEPAAGCAPGGETLLVRIRVDNLGAYAARSPVEGEVFAPTERALPGTSVARLRRGLWVRADSGEEIGVMIRGVPLLGHARAFVGYGERIGQGQAAAWLRIAREADVCLPGRVSVLVEPGQRVLAGSSILAELPDAQ
jgi:phosphatidylserine decarboxylase